ncbi:MAG TPA: ribonuclease P protein component [Steroidobacteraceae bacterium]|nr:ribonuclease P protein component [Steroidobacteraceae bacterium]
MATPGADEAARDAHRPEGSRGAACGFPPERRVRLARDFRRLYAQGRRLGADGFTAVVLPNGGHGPRLGLSVAARTLRRAVERNRMRRLIRESFRRHQHALPALDIVVGLRASPGNAASAQLRRSLERLWQKISAACAPSSAP